MLIGALALSRATEGDSTGDKVVAAVQDAPARN